MILPTHHPAEELLLDYADGSLPEAAALLVATHLALCPGCREAVATMEAIGGALLEESEPAPLTDDCLSELLARLDDPNPAPAGALASPEDILVPQPLRSYLPAPVARLPWQRILPGVDEVPLQVGRPPTQTRLMRIRPGVAVPRHSHEGTEMTLVLQGGYSDRFGHYTRGDAALYVAGMEHRPLADPGETCICLALLDAPLRLTSPLGRILSVFRRF